MADVIRLRSPSDQAATLRAMARDRWRYAVERKLAGDERAYLDGLQDVRDLDDQAHEAALRATRIDLQQAHFERQRLLSIAAIDGLFETVKRRRQAEALAHALDVAADIPESG